MKTMTAKDRLDAFMDNISREELKTLILFTEYQTLVAAEKFEREHSEAPAAAHLEGDFE